MRVIGVSLVVCLVACGSSSSKQPDAAVVDDAPGELIDECATAQHDCDANATCTDLDDGFSCACNPGYEGDGRSCAYAGCAANPCMNGGTCVDGTDSYTCTCASGFSGTTCETNIDDCAANPCRNGGTCADGVATYTCTCPSGTLGTQCERLGPPLVVASVESSYAIKLNGSLWYWGKEVGTGALANVATQIGSAMDWFHIAVGPYHACGLRGTGTLHCWGANNAGQLGNNTMVAETAPIPIGSATWIDVDVGDDVNGHSCGVQSDGSLWCWGSNVDGQLGLGTTSGIYDEPQRVGTDLDWLQVATGSDHTCAVKKTGTMWCWGEDFWDQLNDPASNADKPSPTQIGTATTFVEVRSYVFATCGRHASGSTTCWGNGNAGLGSMLKRMSVGLTHACGVRLDGSLYCNGFNQKHGKLGVGDLADRASPTRVGTDNDWRHVAAGERHSCGIRAPDNLYCWGHNGWGQLGNTTSGHKLAPTQIGAGSTWSTFDVASPTGAGFRIGTFRPGHLCARKSDGTLWCTGENDNGKLGDGLLLPRQTLVQIGTATDWSTTISAGGSTSCALKMNGSLHCWGCRSYGLYNCLTFWGGLTTGSAPTQVGTALTWSSIRGGGTTMCGTQTGDAALCFGNNYVSQVGDGTSSHKVDPVGIGGTTPAWLAVDAGSSHGCGVRSDGTNRTLWCWGWNDEGQLGNNTSSGELISPTQIGTATDWNTISAGYHHTCGTRGTGSLWCWGRNTEAQLGDTTMLERTVPTQIGSATDWTQIAAGEHHTCGIRAPGTLWCWGSNTFGGLGLGDLTRRTSPVQVGSATDWVRIESGEEYTCGLRAGGAMYCWGNNDSGQFGDGTAWTVSPGAVQ